METLLQDFLETTSRDSMKTFLGSVQWKLDPGFNTMRAVKLNLSVPSSQGKIDKLETALRAQEYAELLPQLFPRIKEATVHPRDNNAIAVNFETSLEKEEFIESMRREGFLQAQKSWKR